MKLKFSKMQGLGNDFILINNLTDQYNFTGAQIKFLADRKFGIGCDQVLIIERASDGVSDFYYRIYNSDGSAAAQCGNGARCFIAYVAKNGLARHAGSLQLQTAQRIISGGMLSNGEVWVHMGRADFTPAAIPLCLPTQQLYAIEFGGERVEFAALSLGNPHLVIGLPSLAELANDQRLTGLAQHLQASELFPQSVNVNFCYRASDALLHLRTYERGCGFTLACGSGACASARVVLGLESGSLEVRMPGGSLGINLSDGNIIMQGAAVHVFDGEIEL